jgi:hypothetical protein
VVNNIHVLCIRKSGSCIQQQKTAKLSIQGPTKQM